MEKGGTLFQGEDTHFLYTFLGFLVDLTKLMAEEKGMTLDHKGFQKKIFDTSILCCVNVVVRVDNTQICNRFVLHLGDVEAGDTLKVINNISYKVDY